MSCSFCNTRGHNISRCNSPTIDLLFNRMKSMWIETLNTVEESEREAIYTSALDLAFNLRELKAVGVKYAFGLASWTKPVSISNLCNYFRSRISLPQEEQPWLEARRLPTVPDPIPDFARDLEQPAPQEEQEEERENITWYMDRTPTLRESFMRQISGGDIIYARQIYYSQEDYHRFYGYIPARNLNAEFDAAARKYNIAPSLLVQEGENLEKCEDCPICYEATKLENTVEIGCGHKFCSTCVTKIFKMHKQICAPTCALCRATMQSCSVKNQEVYDQIVEYCNM